MGHIQLETEIAASIERFDLSRNLDLHQRSMGRSKERAVAGVTSGLIGAGESVTWEARHFGLRWRMTPRITEFEPPGRFVDEMTQGPFASFRHEHRFEVRGSSTLMFDIVDFALPFGPFGKIASVLVAGPYLRKLMRLRNRTIKPAAEE